MANLAMSSFDRGSVSSRYVVANVYTVSNIELVSGISASCLSYQNIEVIVQNPLLLVAIDAPNDGDH